MGLVKITFDGSTVSAKQDADINYHLGGLVPAGIIKGLGSELSYSSSNNYITFQDGYVQIYGRRLYVEAGSRVYISLDSTKYGYVIITINLTTNSATLGIAETTSSSYPTLTQQNLSKSGTIYQFPICKYSKTSTSLNIDSEYQRIFIEPALAIATSALTKANEISLKSRYVSASLFDVGTLKQEYSATLKVHFSFNSVYLVVFATGDPYGFGALINVCGTIFYTGMELFFNSNQTQIRDTTNKNWINVSISGTGDGNITISFDSGASGVPGLITIYEFYVQ